MTDVVDPASTRALIFYGEATSIESAEEFIQAKRIDHWRVLTAPFLVDSKRITLYRNDTDSIPSSSTVVEIWAFVLHRFYQDD